jgi:sortase A
VRDADAHVDEATDSDTDTVEATDSNSHAVEVADAHTDAVEVADSNSHAVEVADAHTDAVEVTDSNSHAVEVTDAHTDAVGLPDSHPDTVELADAHPDAVGLSDSHSHAVGHPHRDPDGHSADPHADIAGRGGGHADADPDVQPGRGAGLDRRLRLPAAAGRPAAADRRRGHAAGGDDPQGFQRGMSPRVRRAARVVGIGLLVLGLATIALPFGLVGYGAWRERELTERWATSLRSAPPPASPPAADTAQPSPAPTPIADGIAFAMRVPRLGYYAAVREGVSAGVLADGPGHYPSTAWPGRGAIVGVAAHNTFWLGFANVEPGDEVDMETRYGTFRYRVTGSRLTGPSDGGVLRPAADRQLVLTTCWPLWAGALARQRLVIFARAA